MKRIVFVLAALIFTTMTFAQVAYLQYRVVPADKEQEFLKRETEYWSKVAKKAIDQGKMTGWTLWRKVGVTMPDGPNYVFVNTFASIEELDLAAIWTDENLKALGVPVDQAETNSFTSVPFDYWVYVEDMIPGDFKYALVNYAMPVSRGDFIQENKTLWKPVHEATIKGGKEGMTSWGMMSVIMPQGNLARFSVLTWDGFDTMKSAMNYMRYKPAGGETNAMWTDVMNKTKMNTILPDGFQWRILYERVMSVSAEE